MPGLKISDDPNGYQYNIEETRMNTDPFVRKSMKLWNSQVYESVRGYTKRATLDIALDALANYGKPERLKTDMPETYRKTLEIAIARTKQIFIPSEKLIRFSLACGADNMNKDSAAGFSFPGKKKNQCIEEAYDVAAYIQHRVQRGLPTYKPPCRLALRGHLSSEEEAKSRPVWVYPFEVSILESKWAIPFYTHLEMQVNEVHFGPDAMPRLMKVLSSSLCGHDEAAEVTLDWSQFDATIPCWLINEAFQIIWECFDNKFAFHEGENVFGGEKMEEKNRLLFNWLREYFIKTKIMLPDGSIIMKEHGIPSGSFFTQAVGSIVNCIAIQFLNLHFQWNMRRLKILGDDSSFIVPCYTPRSVVPDKVADLANLMFGLVLKMEKLRIATNQSQRKFLGYSAQGGIFVRPDEDWIKLVLYPERDVQYLEQSAARVMAYYLLGGFSSETYCSFFWDYFARYPCLRSKELIPTRGLKRMFKYVMRKDIGILKVPPFEKLDLFNVPYVLTRNTKPFIE